MLYLIHNRIIIAFKQFLIQITKDAMLFIICFAPLLCGIFIRFGIPIAEQFLCKQFQYEYFLLPYYLLFDLCLAVITPLMFCFISAMVILGEIDDGITKYLAVTPLGKRGYLLSRLGISMVLSISITIIVLMVFSLTNFSLGMIIVIAVLSSIIGFIVSMLVIAISTNKVEGLAVTKLSGLFILGIPVPFFLTSKLQYLLSVLPSFWLSKFAFDQSIIAFVFCIVTELVWMLLLVKRFIRKIY